MSPPPAKPDPASDALPQQTFPKGFTVHLFSFPLAAAHEIGSAVRAELCRDYKIVWIKEVGRVGWKDFYSPGHSSRPPPASPRCPFLRGSRELLRAEGGRTTGRGCLPLSARNSALNSPPGRSLPVPGVIGGKGWGWTWACAAGAGRAPGRAQPRWVLQNLLHRFGQTRGAFRNGSRGQRSEKKK